MTLNNPNEKASVKENSTSVKQPATVKEPYLDKRYVTISLVHNYSNYRKVNMKVLGQKRETIGSSIRSSQVLSSVQGEVEAYFPSLIGVSPSNPEFITKVKTWLSNIQFAINDSDCKLDTSFRYNSKEEYETIKKQEDAINDEYDKVDRGNIKELKEALVRKIQRLNDLESTKYLHGTPVNVEHYLMYRHCLLYPDVAKDIALINSNSRIRFYIKDEQKEAEKQKQLVEQKTRAMKNFVELNGTESKFNAVFVEICSILGENVAMSILKDKADKTNIIIKFVNEYPDKFNRIVDDKQILVKATIETLIARGEFVKSEFNQQISMSDGTFIGSNINEAIAWFENPDNKEVRTMLENKLKLF